MKTIPPFGINEPLIGPDGEEVTVLGFDEITDEEIANLTPVISGEEYQEN